MRYLESEEELKNCYVELRVVSSELFPDPAGQRRSFIVEEDTSMSHRWFTMDCLFVDSIYVLMVFRWHISPPIPPGMN